MDVCVVVVVFWRMEGGGESDVMLGSTWLRYGTARYNYLGNYG